MSHHCFSSLVINIFWQVSCFVSAGLIVNPLCEMVTSYSKTSLTIVPFVCAILLALVFNTYLLVHPAQWTSKVLQLTYLSSDFKIWMVLIACIHFALGYSGEQFVFLRLAKALGKLRKKFRNGKRKQRKQFKVIEEEMRY